MNSIQGLRMSLFLRFNQVIEHPPAPPFKRWNSLPRYWPGQELLIAGRNRSPVMRSFHRGTGTVHGKGLSALARTWEKRNQLSFPARPPKKSLRAQAGGLPPNSNRGSRCTSALRISRLIRQCGPGTILAHFGTAARLKKEKRKRLK